MGFLANLSVLCVCLEKDVCNLPADIGNCQDYTARWYFNAMEGRCRQFYYGGCEGNKNNFQEQNECVDRCEKKKEEPPKQVETRFEPETPDTFRQEYCRLDYDSGECNEVEGRWYYNYREGVCDQFAYGGCGGNQNNFRTEQECQNSCERVRGRGGCLINIYLQVVVC